MWRQKFRRQHNFLWIWWIDGEWSQIKFERKDWNVNGRWLSGHERERGSNPIQYDPTRSLNIFGCKTTTDGIYYPVDGSMKPLQMVFTWWPAIHEAGACASLPSSHLPQYSATLVPIHKLSCAFDTSVHSCHATHLLQNLLPASRRACKGGETGVC